MLTSEQVRAGRALLRWEQKDLAEASGVSLPSIGRLEIRPGPLAAQQRTVDAIVEAFDAAGVTFDLARGRGPGARLKASMREYSARITMEDDDFVVSVRDLPEVVTSGDTLEQALELAEDAIAAVVEWRIAKKMELPEPSPEEPGEHLVSLRAHLAEKAIRYRARKTPA